MVREGLHILIMKSLYLLLLGLIMSLTATADPALITTTLKGHITDATDGEPLVGVIVSIPELQESTVTDADGVEWYVVECERHFDDINGAVIPSFNFLKSKGRI